MTHQTTALARNARTRSSTRNAGKRTSSTMAAPTPRTMANSSSIATPALLGAAFLRRRLAAPGCATVAPRMNSRATLVQTDWEQKSRSQQFEVEPAREDLSRPKVRLQPPPARPKENE